MATKNEAQDTPKQRVVLGAGAVITSNEVILVQAYADRDIETIVAQRNFYEAIAKTLAKYRAADNAQYDMQVASGYTDATWAKGLERLVKKDPEKPRGRKAAAKADPAENC
jgi:hypothetical protein